MTVSPNFLRRVFSGVFLFGCMVTAVASSEANADFLNGEELKLYCVSQNPSDDAICVVYITGAVDAFTTIDLFSEKTKGTDRMFCLGDEAGPDQLRDVTMRWMNRSETDLSFAATLIIWGAIKNTYSC
ncbi:MAG: hypothetical protein CMQ14_07995 [Gammaproteobacteria bacterium]|nr:hypothetical protein [Gammaproteobacteria bacterium]